MILFGTATLVFAQDTANPAQSTPAQSQAEVPIVDNDTSPYHLALLDYKSGHYDAARRAIDAAEQEKPGDFPIEMLKARILTEQDDFAASEKLLKSLLTPANASDSARSSAGPRRSLLRKHSFDRAAKYYGLALQAKPNDPDITLKLVYAEVGISDFVDAGKYASQLKPLDPDHPSYYFAKAALAQATGKSSEADDDIQTARTIYGITVTNHYLKTYLEVFSPSAKGTTSDLTPPLVKPAPSGVKP